MWGVQRPGEDELAQLLIGQREHMMISAPRTIRTDFTPGPETMNRGPIPR